MPHRLLKFAAKSLSREPVARATSHTFTAEDIVWTISSFCALNRKLFDAGLLLKKYPPPYTSDPCMHTVRAPIKQPKILIFDEATSSLDNTTAEHFSATINQLKGKVTMRFISLRCNVQEFSGGRDREDRAGIVKCGERIPY
jgi:hypothetical protein